MPGFDVARRRLGNQRLLGSTRRAPADVVALLVAVQAQDYHGATWALGQRAIGTTQAAVDVAFDAGAVLRTHVMRPTWHFVAPADIRWLLALTAPRVHAVNAYAYRRFELDRETLRRSARVIERALRDSRHRTRAELAARLDAAGIPADSLRLGYLMIHAELEGLICSGPRRGKQFTYALLEEHVPSFPAPRRDEALAELTRRYFTSHGPATLRDFVWWSGLRVRDAKAGLEACRLSLTSQAVGQRVYWFAPGSREPRATPLPVYLLPNYDEYLIAYKDREPPVGAGRDAFGQHLVVDGRVAGSWRRTVQARSVVVEVAPYRPLTRSQTRALGAAVEGLGRFMNKDARLATV